MVVHLQPFRVSGVVTRDGSPVAGATVRFLREGTSVKAEADEDGRYEVALWTPADYGILAWAPGDPSPYPKHLDLTDAGPGFERTLDIELPSRTVSGVVVDKGSGKPIASATVALSEKSTSSGVSRNHALRTGDDGSFRFTNLTDAPLVEVSASADGYLPAEVTVDPASPEADHLLVELERSGKVHGRVVGETGAPVAGAQVMCCPLGVGGGFTARATTDEKGEFALDAREGSRVWAVACGYPFGSARASAEGETVVVLHGARAGDLLRLRTEAGDPVAGVQPVFSAADGARIPSRVAAWVLFLNGSEAVTDANGVLSLAVFPPGTYDVWLQSPEGLLHLGTVPLPSGSPVKLTVPAPR